MKKRLATTVASLMLIGSFAGGASAYQYGQGQQQGQYQQQHQDHNQQTGDMRHDDGRDRRDNRHRWRDQRRDARWDQAQYNGYYQNNVWHYGPPPQDRYGRPGFSLGYHPWARGQRLGYYNTRYQEVDYRSHHLRAPRRGYHWVQDDQGNLLLAAIATGLIASVILNDR